MPIPLDVFALNGLEVTAPDEEVWIPIVQGDALTGRQKRSPYERLEWRKQVADHCRLDWFAFDNTTLSSLRTRMPGSLTNFVVYTDAVCQSVTFRQRRGLGGEVIARFIVCIGSGS